jgi:hypothetical protein
MLDEQTEINEFLFPTRSDLLEQVDSLRRELTRGQVNATDLRNINYPTRGQLEALGRRLGAQFPEQRELDRLVGEESF